MMRYVLARLQLANIWPQGCGGNKQRDRETDAGESEKHRVKERAPCI